MKASDLNGMAVVSLGEGAKLGVVDQPLFDLAERRVCALHVKGGSGITVLPFEQIENIGSDAVTVTTSRVTQTPGVDSAGQGLLDLSALRKLKVVDRDGTYLGNLSEIEFDPASGQVTHLSAHKGGVLGVGGTTTPIGPDASFAVGSELLTINSGTMNRDSTDADTAGYRSDAATSQTTPAPSATAYQPTSTDVNETSRDVNEGSQVPRPPMSPDDPWD